MLRTKTEYLQQTFGTTDEVQIWHKEEDNIHDAHISGTVKLALPYEAPVHPPLPSVEEIRQAWKTSRLTQPGGLCSVCRIGPMVVKFSTGIRILQEAENLLYLQEHTKVRAPRLYAAYKENYPQGEDGLVLANFLVMEFIEGMTMTEDYFMDMEKRDQRMLLQRLGEQLQLLRSVKPPGRAYYGRVNHQGWTRITSFLYSMKPGFQGPYDT
ncbi:hypothetical protein PMIN06_002499 [Paraphaeosphaeria minitans]